MAAPSEKEMHYRVKSRYVFGNVLESFIHHASIPANKIYQIVCQFRETYPTETQHMKVLTVRNADDDVHIGFDVTEDLSSDVKHQLVSWINDRYTDGKIWGIWQNIYPKTLSLLYGLPYIMDYMDIGSVRFNVPVGINSFTTLNRSTMTDTYDWIQKRILLKDVVVIGRDTIRSSFWFTHYGHRVTALVESDENYEDSLLSLKHNKLEIEPTFLRHGTTKFTTTSDTKYCLVFNGRDFNRNAAGWLKDNLPHVDRVIVLTCKDYRVPPMEGWSIIDTTFIDQQPGTDIKQQMNLYVKAG